MLKNSIPEHIEHTIPRKLTQVSSMKRGKNDLLLEPQPIDDANDYLNWPVGRPEDLNSCGPK